MLELLAFLTGMGAGLLNHEAGHHLAATALQDDISWSGASWRCEAGCNAANIARYGMIAQSLSSEVLLNSPAIPRDHPMVAGWLVWNIANPILYTIKHETSGPHGDFSNFSRREAHIMEIALLAHAASTVLRWSDNLGNIEPFVFPQDDGVAFGVAVRW